MKLNAATRGVVPAAVVLLLADLFASSLAMAVNGQTELSPSRRKELSNLVLQDCGSCHGMRMSGGLGKPLLPKNLSDYSARTVADVILGGVPGTPMPPWRGLLKDHEALWIARQLKAGALTPGGVK